MLSGHLFLDGMDIGAKGPNPTMSCLLLRRPRRRFERDWDCKRVSYPHPKDFWMFTVRLGSQNSSHTRRALAKLKPKSSPDHKHRHEFLSESDAVRAKRKVRSINCRLGFLNKQERSFQR